MQSAEVLYGVNIKDVLTEVWLFVLRVYQPIQAISANEILLLAFQNKEVKPQNSGWTTVIDSRVNSLCWFMTGRHWLRRTLCCSPPLRATFAWSLHFPS